MRYIVLDLEYTRIIPSEIYEIGALKVEFNPTENRPKITGNFSLDIHPMHLKKNRSAPYYKNGLPRFLDWIGSEEYLIVAWGQEDFRMFHRDCTRNKMDHEWLANTKYIDLQKHYQKLLIDKYIYIHPCLQKMLRNGIKISSLIGLKDAILGEDFSFNGTAHKAYIDAYNTTKIFMKYFYNWSFVNNVIENQTGRKENEEKGIEKENLKSA